MFSLSVAAEVVVADAVVVALRVDIYIRQMFI